jgi:hypothetical protein
MSCNERSRQATKDDMTTGADLKDVDTIARREEEGRRPPTSAPSRGADGAPYRGRPDHSPDRTVPICCNGVVGRFCDINTAEGAATQELGGSERCLGRGSHCGCTGKKVLNSFQATQQ